MLNQAEHYISVFRSQIVPLMDLPPNLPPTRPDVVVVAGHVSKTGTVVPGEPHEHGEMPHGGDPIRRGIRLASTTTTTSHVVIFVDQPWRDSASGDIDERTTPDQSARISSRDYNVKSTEGITRKQHQERNAQVPPQTRVTWKRY
jgi:hypothetical protein